VRSLEGSFEFVAFFDLNIIVSPTYIQFGKVLGFGQCVDEVRDKGERIAVLNGDLV